MQIRIENEMNKEDLKMTKKSVENLRDTEGEKSK